MLNKTNSTRKFSFINLQIILCISFIFSSQAIAGNETSLLEKIKERGYLNCGVTGGTTLMEIDQSGTQRGFFAEYCKVLGAAIFGNKEAVKYVSVDGSNRFKALESGIIDVLMSNTTRTTLRDTKYNLDFTSSLYYDGQGFLAYKKLNAKSLSEVSKARVCVNKKATSYLNVI